MQVSEYIYNFTYEFKILFNELIIFLKKNIQINLK